MSIGVGDRVKRAKALYEHSTRLGYREPERLGTVLKVLPHPQHEGDQLVRVEWDEVHDPALVGGNAKRTMMRGSSLVVVEAAPRAAATDNLRERLAALAHEQWSGWMKYMFSKCASVGDGCLLIPAWAVERWMGQMNLPYAELSEQEKELDRTEADKVLALLVGKL